MQVSSVQQSLKYILQVDSITILSPHPRPPKKKTLLTQMRNFSHLHVLWFKFALDSNFIVHRKTKILPNLTVSYNIGNYYFPRPAK